MNSYQKEVWDKFSNYRPSATYPVYPPYHEGPYLEDYVFQRFQEDEREFDRIFIPVGWTTCYIENKTTGLQDLLNTLDRSKKYFTVSQHDDAIREQLPPDTLCFNAGGNGGGIPIPLICSPIPSEIIPPHRPAIMGSFIGSITHPIRANLMISLKDHGDYAFRTKRWTDSVSNQELMTFIEITSRSMFSFCPRGYGKSSFRLYESLQIGAIPVYIYDTPWIPFQDELDWSEFCVLVESHEIIMIDQKLMNLTRTPELISTMSKRGKEVWESHFSLPGLYNQITKRI